MTIYVTLDAFKTHANLAGDQENDLLTSMLATAQGMVEAIVGRTLGSYLDDADYVNTIPAPLLTATLSCATALYDGRGDQAAGVPADAWQLCAPFRSFPC